jgi:hypothetical protein
MGRGDDAVMEESSSPLQSSEYTKPEGNINSNSEQQKKSKKDRRGSTTATKEAAKYSTNEEPTVYPRLDNHIEPSAPELELAKNSLSSNVQEFRGLAEGTNLQEQEWKSPYNKQTGQLELSKYRNPAMLDAIDHLTSVPYQLKSLFWPSMKIAGRALWNRNTMSVKELFADLSPNKTEEEKQSIKEAEQHKREEVQQRALFSRVVYFVLVGIPSALLVGLVFGLLTFLGNLLKDIYTVSASGLSLFSQARQDIRYFHDNPAEMPTQEQATEAITDQVVMPYARTLVKKKLGPISFMARPADFLLNRVIKQAARNSGKMISWVAGLPQVQSATKQVKERLNKAERKKREL